MRQSISSSLSSLSALVDEGHSIGEGEADRWLDSEETLGPRGGSAGVPLLPLFWSAVQLTVRALLGQLCWLWCWVSAVV